MPARRLLAFSPEKRILLHAHWFFRFALNLIGSKVFYASSVLSVDVSSSAMQWGGSSSLSERVIFKRSLMTESNISSKLLLLVGKVTSNSSGGLFGSDPRSLFVNFLIELVLMSKTKELMSKTKGSTLACPVGAGVCQEMPPMALPLVDISPSLQEGQFLMSPCHWTPKYEQGSYLRLLETWHFEGMCPSVSRLRGQFALLTFTVCSA
eukprot:Gb_41322 [translate_table: standard]